MLMSEAFSMGDCTTLNHNLRIAKGRGYRQNGAIERRSFNEYIDIDNELYQQCLKNKKMDYETEIIKKTLLPMVIDEMNAYNERQIRGRHSNRIKTFDDWLSAKAKQCGGKVTSEYIAQIGDHITSAPFVCERDEDGKPLDKDGNIISSWHTNKKLIYKDGKVVMDNKHLADTLKEFYQRFKKANPNFLPLGCFLHGDESSWHIHVTGIWLSHCKTEFKVGLGETSGLKEQYANRGIKVKDSQMENGMTMWNQEMRLLLEEVCKENGIERLDMENKEKHRTKKQYLKFADKRAQALAEIEAELVAHLDEKEAGIDKKMLLLKEKESDINDRIKDFNDRIKDFNEKKKEFNERKKQEEKAQERLHQSLNEKAAVLALRESEITKKESEIAKRETEAENLIHSSDEVKPYLVHHFDVLKEKFPDIFEAVHRVVIERFGGKAKAGGKTNGRQMER